MILEQIANALNRNIAASSRAQSLCGRLEGRALAVHVEGLRLDVVARIEAGQIALGAATEREPDATVSGTPLTLLSMVGPGARGRLRSGAVTISGDAEIAQTFQDLLRAAQPEFEEELSRLVGDVTAHQIGNLLRTASGWGRKATATLAANVSEYLQEESRDLVTRTELEEFLSAVDELRESADRLQARLELLPSPQPSPVARERENEA
jgi:ubiquinone biosynthesis accessory factor UbiJ